VKRLQTGLPDIGTGIPTTPHAIAWNGKVQQPFAGRTREQVARFFTGLDLVEPGLVPVEEWRPHPGTGKADSSAMWGAVVRKR
jgi:hypothetical protein